jgi:hypothetical protein
VIATTPLSARADFRHEQLCMRFGKRAIGVVGRFDESAQLVELAEPGQTRYQEAGVDRASDASSVRDRGDNRDAHHVVDVAGRQRAPFLGDQDDPVERLLGGDERGHSDVAGPTQHGVALARLCGDRPEGGPGVHYERTRAVGDCTAQPQPGGDLRRLLTHADRQAQERRCGGRIGGHECGRLVIGLEQGDHAGDRGCALTASGADQLDRSGRSGHSVARWEGSLGRIRSRDGRRGFPDARRPCPDHRPAPA